MLIDSHCHLDFSDFKEDMPLVLQRAKESGVGVMQTICTRLSRFPEVLALTLQEDNIYCSVGIHPHNVEQEPEFQPFKILEEVSSNQKIIGIGETGLDYFYDHSDREKQRASFVAHIEVARESGLPVIIHSRDADKDMIQILEEESAKGTFPGVIHCFTAGYELAKAAINWGLSISLSGLITFKNAEELRAVAKTLPIDHLLLETDAPFLAPVPCRGQRNEPSFLKHTAEFVSTMLDIDSCVLEEKTTGNFYRLFNRVNPDT